MNSDTIVRMGRGQASVAKKTNKQLVKRSILTRRQNQYGNVAAWDKKDTDGKIVHINVDRISVTCKANGIDYRRCVYDTNKYGPIYSGVYIAAVDLPKLNNLIAEKNDRAANRSLKRLGRSFPR